MGERLAALTRETPLRALTAILLLSPQIPLLFMGEEWASKRPFLFFCDFSGELAEAVCRGRRREFARFPAFLDPARQALIPDPNACETFTRSRLDWRELERPESGRHLDLVRRLLEIRRRAIVPRLTQAARGGGIYEVAEDRALHVHWRLAEGSSLYLAANLSPQATATPAWILPGEQLFTLPDGFPTGQAMRSLPPWSVCFTLDAGVSKP